MGCVSWDRHGVGHSGHDKTPYNQMSMVSAPPTTKRYNTEHGCLGSFAVRIRGEQNCHANNNEREQTAYIVMSVSIVSDR